MITIIKFRRGSMKLIFKTPEINQTTAKKTWFFLNRDSRERP